MKKYFSAGGAVDPNFKHKVEVNHLITEDMIKWCENFPLNSDFERYYIKWYLEICFSKPKIQFQFESEEAAIMFKLTWL